MFDEMPHTEQNTPSGCSRRILQVVLMQAGLSRGEGLKWLSEWRHEGLARLWGKWWMSP